MSNLKDLYLGGNVLSGSIAFEIFNISTLENIELQDNGLSGDLPHDICGRLPKLKILSLASNRLSGPLPSAWSQCLQLQGIYLSGNSFSGLMPKELFNLKALEDLHLEMNNLQGIIPEEIGNLTKLRKLTLYDNNLTGVIPKEIANITTLMLLDLRSNQLRGAIPLEMGNLYNLEEIHLDNNSFSGSIPERIFNISAMGTIGLSFNYLSGKLPSTAGFGLPNLENLYLAYNQFSGVIPPSLSNSSRLQVLELSYNQFTGTIPSSFGNLRSLEYLNLYGNKLTRGSSALEMDFFTPLSNCNLTYLDLSFNPLNGALPKSIGNFSRTIEQLQMEGCGLSPKRSWAKGLHHILLLSFGILAFIVVVAVGVVYLIFRKKDTISGTEEFSPRTGRKRISYHELQQATQGYDERNLLGQGSFGSVYRGTLRDGQVIAVKVFNLQMERALKSFDVECEVLRNLRHRNLTPVISSCSNEDFRALVLEFMPNGNLENWLHSENRFLNLIERLSIMIDVACALQYLHSGYSIPVVHSDLKPSNVLVDGDMIGHVSDFGIAKILVEESIDYTNTLATFGYIAPEYGSEGLVSTKCDVYSYGIMLMEVFTRKRPDDEMFDENLTLQNWVNQSIENNTLPEMIDDGLIERVEEEQFDVILECLLMIMNEALNCTKASPKERSDIGDVLVSLNKIKLKLP